MKIIIILQFCQIRDLRQKGCDVIGRLLITTGAFQHAVPCALGEMLVGCGLYTAWALEFFHAYPAFRFATIHSSCSFHLTITAAKGRDLLQTFPWPFVSLRVVTNSHCACLQNYMRLCLGVTTSPANPPYSTRNTISLLTLRLLFLFY